MAICTGTLPATLPSASAGAILSMRDRPASRQAWTTRPCFPLHHSRVRWGAAMDRIGYRIPNDQDGMALLCALAARPPRINDQGRFDKTVKAIDQAARHGVRHITGSFHPEYPPTDGQSYSYHFLRRWEDGEERTAPQKLLSQDFDRALCAGRNLIKSILWKSGERGAFQI